MAATIHNQARDLVMSGEHKYLVRKPPAALIDKARTRMVDSRRSRERPTEIRSGHWSMPRTLERDDPRTEAAAGHAQRTIRKLLIANRGEIAVRIARTAAEMGIATRRGLLRGRRGLAAQPQGRRGRGAARAGRRRPISTSTQVVAAAKAAGCDAVHPGYGFLSRERGVRARLRRGGADLRRADARDPGAVRRQGRGAGAGASSAACRCCAGTDGPTTLDGARRRSSARSARAAR